jgi:hypothetical protein
MSDDSFIREVDEQFRQDRAKELWARFGKYVIALAVLVVLGTAAWQGWQYYTQQRAAASGDGFLTALKEAEAGNYDAAVSGLAALEEDGVGDYPALAEMASAAALAAKGDKEAAIKAYDQAAANSSLSDEFRDIARLRAGLLAVDTEDYAGVSARLEPMAAAGQPFRSLAREALGIAAMKAGDDRKAFEWYKAIADDTEAASGAKGRAAMMLDILAGRGVTADS